MRSQIRNCFVAVAALLAASGAGAAGTLTPAGSSGAPIQIREHHAQIVINNGFAQTEVTQIFFNPNPVDLEGDLRLPGAAQRQPLRGHDLHRRDGDQRGGDRRRGRRSGSTRRNATRATTPASPPRTATRPTSSGSRRSAPRTETRLRFVYYQPLEIDSGVGRYLYPLEDGGTDEIAKSFWVPEHPGRGLPLGRPRAQERLARRGRARARLRGPGRCHRAGRGALQGAAASGRGRSWTATSSSTTACRTSLPGRVEVIPTGPMPTAPGTFMMVVTPGLDLQPITGGADYIFVLDVSGKHVRQDPDLGPWCRQGAGRARRRRPLPDRDLQRRRARADPRLDPGHAGERGPIHPRTWRRCGPAAAPISTLASRSSAATTWMRTAPPA